MIGAFYKKPKIAFFLTCLGLIISQLDQVTLAQIIPDQTLGTENSVVNQINEHLEHIEGGAIRGANIFHSFLEFNIAEGAAAYFANPQNIVNIFSRVTGQNPSHLMGTLGVLGNANLFFMNPNGIVFGPNSQLDIAGSFVATTANSFTFPNGEYSAVNPQTPPLLTVTATAPIGLRLEGPNATIINQGNLAAGGNLTLAGGNLDLQGQLLAGENLTLRALDTVKIRDSVPTPFIAAAAENLLIQGEQTVDIYALNHPHSGLFAGADFIMRSPNPIIGDAHYWSRGNFQIEDLEGNLGDLNSIEDPIIRAAGDVSFNSYEGTSLHIIAGGSVNAGTIIITDVETGTPGIDFIQEDITLTYDGTVINIDGSQQATVDIRAGVKPEAIGMTGITGPATSADITIGDIAIIPENGVVLLTNQYEPNLSLSGGDINILSQQGLFEIGIFSLNPLALVAIDARGNVNINGSILAESTSTLKEGGDVIVNSQEYFSLTNGLINVTGNEGGNIKINAKNINIVNSIILGGIGSGLGFDGAGSGDIRLNATETLTVASSLVFNEVNFGAIGDSGKVIINAQEIAINNSMIASEMLGRGNSGAVQIKANEGITIDGESSGIFSVVFPDAVGTSGGIVIDTSTLSLTNGGTISASTFGQGDSGAVQIKANESITIDGEGSNGLPSGIFSQVNSNAVGTSGGTVIDTSTLSLTNGGIISAATFGQGDAGAVKITTGSLSMTNGTQLSSITLGQGNAGDITLNARDSLLLSTINSFSLAENEGNSGNAGNITIKVPEGNILFNGSQESPSLINSFSVADNGISGNGGDVNIVTNGNLNNVEIITLSSSGESGSVKIESPSNLSLNNVTVTTSQQFTVEVPEPTMDNPNNTRTITLDIDGNTGQTGDFLINTSGNLTLNNSNILADTKGTNPAGNVNLTSQGAITLNDTSALPYLW